MDRPASLLEKKILGDGRASTRVMDKALWVCRTNVALVWHELPSLAH